MDMVEKLLQQAMVHKEHIVLVHTVVVDIILIQLVQVAVVLVKKHVALVVELKL